MPRLCQMSRRLRQTARVSYYEPEEPDLDEYVFCENCGDYVFEYCAIHGALLVIPDDKVPTKHPYPPYVPRAALTVPRTFLHINYSSIPGAGLGVFTTLTLPRGVRFGPYRGERTKEVTSDYSWQIYDRNNKPCHVVDAADGNKSNWMRYVNCSRHWSEQNLVAFQYRGQLYYRTIKIIPRFTELMVFYGSEFANLLDIDLGKYNSPKSYAQKFGARVPKKPQSDVNKKPQQVLGIKPSEETKGSDKQVTNQTAAANTVVKGTKRKASNIQHVNGTPAPKQCKAVETKKSNHSDNLLKPVEEIKPTTVLDTQHTVQEPSEEKKQSTVGQKTKSRKKFIVPKLKPCIDTRTKENMVPKNESNPKTDLTDIKSKDKARNPNTNFNKTLVDTVPSKNKNKEYTLTNSKDTKIEIVSDINEKIALGSTFDNKKNILSKYDPRPNNKQEVGLVNIQNLYYSCDFCKYQCVTKDTLERHMNLHDKNRKFQCETCTYRFPTNNHLRTHIISFHGVRTNTTAIHECDGQEYTSTNNRNLKTNLLQNAGNKTHTNEKKFACDICDYKCNKKTDLKRHLMIHSGEKPHACSMCEYKCTRANNLKLHLRTHTGEKPFSCDICDYKFTKGSSLKTHLRTHTGEKPYSCDICDYKFTKGSSLKTHLRTHTGEKPYSCDICDYKCNQKTSLKHHLMIHSSEKPHACSMCEYKCTFASTLKLHLRAHTGEKPYSCDICDYKCNHKISLKHHLMIHSGDKPHACSMCEYKCTFASTLKLHLRTHTGEKPYSCDICDYKCNFKSKLNEHLKKKHLKL